MVNMKELWFVAADNHGARLLHGATTRAGSLHITEVAALDTTFVPGERQRPTRLGRPGSGAADVGHEKEEELAHVARALGPWLQQELALRTITRCALFAPSHLLGALHKQIPKQLAALLPAQPVDLTGMSPGQLAGHPRIVELLAD